jgi:hypothetical protein
MTTCAALEALTDAGRFELLSAIAVGLRNREYACLISTGINATGGTIRSVVDGMGRIPGSNPAHFVLMASTTTDSSHLKGKLLGEGREQGDMPKAAQHAKDLRREIPDARFTLVLTTNRRVGAELLADVQAQADRLGISCDLWDQSRIARELDAVPEGQWLRREYLGIEVEQISRSLLADVALESCNTYERDASSLLGRQWIAREVDKQLRHLLASRETNLVLLVGRPGFGKSVAAAKLLRSVVAAGGIGLRVPAEALLGGSSLENILGLQLRNARPSLDRGQSSRATEFLESHERLLLVVDDIDHLSDPATSLRKLLAWTQTSDPERVGAQWQRILVACPVWPSTWRGVAALAGSRRDLSVVRFEIMELAEAVDAVRASAERQERPLGMQAAIRVAKECGCDPFLLGMWDRLGLASAQSPLKRGIIEEFVEIETHGLEGTSDARFLASEYRSALVSLVAEMIRARRLRASIDTVRTWFSSQTDLINAIRELARRGSLIESGEDGLLRFRHERLLGHFAIEVLSAVVGHPGGQEVIDDPWFADWLAEACLSVRPKADVLRQILSKNPWCGVELVRRLKEPLDSFAESVLQSILEEVVRTRDGVFARGPLHSALCSALLDAPKSVVAQLRVHIPDGPSVLLAGLRHGCALDGIVYCASKLGWYPSFGDGRLEACLDDMGVVERVHLVQELRMHLHSGRLTQEGLVGAFALAGALAEPQLAEPVARSWKRVEEKDDALVHALWAGLRCGSSDYEAATAPLVEHWATLSDEAATPHQLSPRNQVADSLRLCLAPHATAAMVSHLVDTAGRMPELKWPIRIVLSDVDHPDAVEFNLSVLASGKYLLDPIQWNPRFGRRGLSDDSRSRLQGIWADESRSERLRKSAFVWWGHGAFPQDLEILQAVSSSDPLWQSAVRKRGMLGDQTVIPSLAPLLEEDAWNFGAAHAVWTNEFAAIADMYLRSLATQKHEPYSPDFTHGEEGLVECLARIPPQTASTLLLANWAHLSVRPKFVELSLYIGSRELLEQVDDAFRSCPADKHAVRYIQLDLGWHYTDSEIPPRIVADRIANLLPYVSRLDENDVFDMAHRCEALGLSDILRGLGTYLPDKTRKHLVPTDDDLAEELDHLAALEHGAWHVQFMVESSVKRGEDPARLAQAVAGWLRHRIDLQALAIAAEYLALAGGREGISLLDLWGGDANEVAFRRARSDTLLRIRRRTLT